MSYTKLIREMKKRDMNIRQLAIAADITPQSLYGAIHGRVYFWPGWRKRIADVLGVDENDIFTDEK